jgi:hypothetical protein
LQHVESAADCTPASHARADAAPRRRPALPVRSTAQGTLLYVFVMGVLSMLSLFVWGWVGHLGLSLWRIGAGAVKGFRRGHGGAPGADGGAGGRARSSLDGPVRRRRRVVGFCGLWGAGDAKEARGGLGSSQGGRSATGCTGAT